MGCIESLKKFVMMNGKPWNTIENEIWERESPEAKTLTIESVCPELIGKEIDYYFDDKAVIEMFYNNDEEMSKEYCSYFEEHKEQNFISFYYDSYSCSEPYLISVIYH